MKILILITTMCLTASSFASDCINAYGVDDYICVGDKVHPQTNTYPKPLVVLSVDPGKDEITTNSHSTLRGKTTFTIDKIAVKKGCLADICVGDIINIKNNSIIAPLKVLGVNLGTHKITTESFYPGYTEILTLDEVVEVLK